MTNVAWMRPSSVVLEIILRSGWCNDPFKWPFDEDHCKPYHKADYANMVCQSPRPKILQAVLIVDPLF